MAQPWWPTLPFLPSSGGGGGRGGGLSKEQLEADKAAAMSKIAGDYLNALVGVTSSPEYQGLSGAGKREFLAGAEQDVNLAALVAFPTDPEGREAILGAFRTQLAAEQKEADRGTGLIQGSLYTLSQLAGGTVRAAGSLAGFGLNVLGRVQRERGDETSAQAFQNWAGDVSRGSSMFYEDAKQWTQFGRDMVKRRQELQARSGGGLFSDLALFTDDYTSWGTKIGYLFGFAAEQAPNFVPYIGALKVGRWIQAGAGAGRGAASALYNASRTVKKLPFLGAPGRLHTVALMGSSAVSGGVQDWSEAVARFENLPMEAITSSSMYQSLRRSGMTHEQARL